MQSDFFFGHTSEEGRKSSLTFALEQLNLLEDHNLQENPVYPMYMWSVLDMLSRFNSGQLDNQRASKRLKDFLREHFPHKRNDTQTLLSFRNACAHSVNLYNGGAKSDREWRFRLTLTGDFVQYSGRATAVVNVFEFKSRLIRSIESYKTTVENDELRAERFEKVYAKMGYVKS